jgi:heparan-alpha-glucosaminide N-acetyltransferase
MNQTHRIDSIDVFRAITMFFMIFVNDLWTVHNVPDWLEHSKASEDAMGFADTIFPAFLFIVGLSIPFAISNRKVKGDSRKTILAHIVERFLALLIMGLFTVNLENAYGEAMIIDKGVREIIMIVAFFLVWNVYPKDKDKPNLYKGLKVLGYLLLFGLAIIYKGGDAQNITWMKTHWWGILGLIAWAYLICSLLYLFIGDHPVLIATAWLFFVVFNVAAFAGWLDFLSGVRKYVWIVGDGSMPGFTMAGVFASVLYRKLPTSRSATYYLVMLLGLGLCNLILGFALRPFWGISKIMATPSWLGICTGISFLVYLLLFWLVDLKRKTAWFSILKPAGIATLTCYLIPYLWYPTMHFLGAELPEMLITGWVGLVKSFLFSLLVIAFTRGLIRVGVRLKV